MAEGRGDGSVAAQLQQLILRSGSVELFLEAFALHASKILGPEVEVLCGITLKRRDLVVTAGSSGEATELNKVQSDYGDGPCLNAAGTGQTVLVEDVRTDTRWSECLQGLGDRGFTSVLGVPVMIGRDGGAAINLYARKPGVFSPDVIEGFEQYASEAASSLELALKLAAYRDSTADLYAAMDSRTNIDIAVGIVIAQNHCIQAEAVQVLRRAAGQQHLKLRTLAEQIVQSINSVPATTHFTPAHDQDRPQNFGPVP
ncbi:GAF and ANTAR domain-containing protein [Arthrobacter sp. Hz1]